MTYVSKIPTWEDVLEGFDLKRIRNIPIAEKFRLVEFIKMLAQEAALLEENGYESFGQRSLEGKDNTYRMLIYLYEQRVPIEDFKEVVLNYLVNYEFSDIYYSKLAIIGMGIMLFYQRRDPFTVFNGLLVLLGQEFLTYNLKYIGYRQAITSEAKPDSIIRYKEYESSYRKIKYDLLSFNYMAKEQGIEVLEHYLHNYYKNDKISLLFTLLNDVHPDVRHRSYRRLERDASDMDLMILAGIYSILHQKSTILSHYMMNSRIGKFDHSGGRPEKVKNEAYQGYLAMMAQMEEESHDQ